MVFFLSLLFCFHSVAADEKEKPREFHNGLWSRLGDDPRANLQETVGVVDHRHTSRTAAAAARVKNDGRDSKGENKVPCRRQRKRRRRRRRRRRNG